MYKIRVTTTVEQVDHDGRVLFSVTDSEDGSSIFDDNHENQVSVSRGYVRTAAQLEARMFHVLEERFEPIRKRLTTYPC